MIPERNDTPPVTHRAANKAKVAAFVPSDNEKRLKEELFRWHEERAKELYSDVDFYGADMFMHYSIVECIVKLAHVYKISSIPDLKNQTAWCFAEKFGGGIVDLIHQFCPKPSLFTRAPLLLSNRIPNSNQVADPHSSEPSVTKKVQAPPTCSSCGTKGHCSEYQLYLCTQPSTDDFFMLRG